MVQTAGRFRPGMADALAEAIHVTGKAGENDEPMAS